MGLKEPVENTNKEKEMHSTAACFPAPFFIPDLIYM